MPLTVNLRHLERDSLTLKGTLTPEELDLGVIDMVVQALPLTYDLRVELLQGNILAQGAFEMDFDCECVRCLKTFRQRVSVCDWACHLTLEGEEAVPVLNDLVDLAPSIREEIFLALPLNPVCNPGCHDLPGQSKARVRQPKRGAAPEPGSTAWAALDKLKLD